MMPTIIGTAGNDHLIGTPSKDTIYGRAGNDQLDGGLGDDALFGEADDDRLYGQAGNDRLFGGTGNDLLDGGIGDDVLNGNVGDDMLFGGEDNDDLRGRLGHDRLFGDVGDDVVTAYSQDSIDTGSGDDRVSLLGSDSLAATITFGEGADVLTMEYNGGNQAFAGGGQTTITDFTHGSDHIGALNFAIVDDLGLETVDFTALDSNKDGKVAAGDAGVSFADDTLTIDLGAALTTVASEGRPGFHVTSPIVLSLQGIAELRPDDFVA
jgi:Ca2+-binding RTX toxin-like protein